MPSWICQLNHHSGAKENTESKSKYYASNSKPDNGQQVQKRETLNRCETSWLLPSWQPRIWDPEFPHLRSVYSIHLENFRQDFVHSWIHCLLTIISSSFNRYLLSHSHEPVYRALFGCRQDGGSKEKGSALIFWTYSPYSRWFWSLCISPTHLSSAWLWRTVTSPRTYPTSGSYHSPKMWVAKRPRLPTF